MPRYAGRTQGGRFPDYFSGGETLIPVLHLLLPMGAQGFGDLGAHAVSHQGSRVISCFGLNVRSDYLITGVCCVCSIEARQRQSHLLDFPPKVGLRLPCSDEQPACPTMSLSVVRSL